MSKKSILYFYSTLNKYGDTVYRYIDNEEQTTTIYETKTLDYKNNKNYAMTSTYNAIDADLFKFRADLNKYNNEIKEHFFKNKDKKIFKIDVFNYNTIRKTIYNNIIINSDQKTINQIPNIAFKEFLLFEKCLSCGLIRLKQSIIEKPIDVYGYDYSKYYYYMMRKIRIPKSAPRYTTLKNLDFDNL